MTSKVSPDQGSLLTPMVEERWAPEPSLAGHPEVVGYEAEIMEPEYSEPEEVESPAQAFADPQLLETVGKAVSRDRKRKAQVGQHSPFQRSGRYSAVLPGDYLPEFGPVTDSNFASAKKHAELLDERRAKQLRASRSSDQSEIDQKGLSAARATLKSLIQK